MIRIFGDQHMGNGAFGRQRSLDQMGRSFRLGDAALAAGAGIFRPDRHKDTQLGRDDIKALGPLLTNAHHLATAARAKNAVRFDDVLDAGQLFGQIAKVAFRLCGLLARGIVLRAGLLLFGLGNRHLELFKAQLAIVRGKLFGLLGVKGMAQFLDQMLKPLDDILALVRRPLQITGLPFGLQQGRNLSLKSRLQIGGKSFKINGFQGRGHACFIQENHPARTAKMPPESLCRTRAAHPLWGQNTAPVQTFK